MMNILLNLRTISCRLVNEKERVKAMEERLQKVIAQSGYTSRRKAEELIQQGKVTVNGEVVTVLGTKVTKKDTICVNGKIINKEDKVYYLFYKPEKCVCTMSD